MKSFWTRKLVVPLVLACAGTQVAPGAALRASALTLGLHESDHAHSVSLVAEEGHLHLVLSHDERGGQDPGGARHHGDPATSTSERDHVFKLTDDDAANTRPRRASFAPALAIATAVGVLRAPTPLWIVRSSPEPRARSSDFLRTVVLRL